MNRYEVQIEDGRIWIEECGADNPNGMTYARAQMKVIKLCEDKMANVLADLRGVSKTEAEWRKENC